MFINQFSGRTFQKKYKKADFDGLQNKEQLPQHFPTSNTQSFC